MWVTARLMQMKLILADYTRKISSMYFATAEDPDQIDGSESDGEGMRTQMRMQPMIGLKRKTRQGSLSVRHMPHKYRE